MPMDMAAAVVVLVVVVVVVVVTVQQGRFEIIALEDMGGFTPSQKCLRSHHRESASEWIVADNRNRHHDSEP